MTSASHTVAEVASRYGVSVHTVLSWISRAELVAINVARRASAKRPTWRVTDAAIREFEARRSPAAPVSRPRRRRAEAGVIEFYKV